MNHYTYYIYEEFGRGYIGVRSCKCPINEDKYMGSCKDDNFKPTQKIILSEYETREDAVNDEILLHNFYDVVVNNHFANKCKQTSVWFDRTGHPVSEETKSKISKFQKGRPKLNTDNYKKPKSEEHREKLREIQKRRTELSKTPEAIEKWKQNNKWSEERRRQHSEKMSEKMRGKKRGPYKKKSLP